MYFDFGADNKSGMIGQQGDDFLFFNGCGVYWMSPDGNTIKASWKGVSGHQTSPTSGQGYNESTKNHGPLPSSATYVIDPSKIQYRFDTYYPTIFVSSSPSEKGSYYVSGSGWIRQARSEKAEYLYPSWAADGGEANGWGIYRVNLQVASGKVPSSRDENSFWLHGSTNGWGSAGCIDTGNGVACTSLFQSLKDYGKKIELNVKYQCNPWTQKWINGKDKTQQ